MKKAVKFTFHSLFILEQLIKNWIDIRNFIVLMNDQKIKKHYSFD